MKLEEAHKKEIHHRVKNNLQIISSLLDLEAEMLAGNNVCNTSKVLEAFKESKNRIAAMDIIHEEFHKSTDTNYLDFSAYLKNLTAYIIDLYKMKTVNISLKFNLEQIFLGMDTAIPLGNIVTELISNALKHAFPKGSDGEISIIFLQKRELHTVSRKVRRYQKRLGMSKYRRPTVHTCYKGYWNRISE